MALISDVRIRAKVKFDSTVLEDTYELHLIDADYDNTTDGDPLELEADRDGFTLEWRGSDEIQTVLGSKCSFGFMVTDSDTETLASDLLSLQEDRFGLRLYKDSELYWFGMIYQDEMNIDLIHKPYLVRVSAMDGLGALNTISQGFPDAGPETGFNYDAGNFATVLIHMLKQLDKLDLGASDKFLTSSVALHSDGHRTYTSEFDTLAETRIAFWVPLFFKSLTAGMGQYTYYNTSGYIGGLNGGLNAFYRTNLFEGRPWKEVVERILKPFFCQIKMVDGAYDITPINKYKSIGSQATRVFERDYEISLTDDPTTALNYDTTTRTLARAFGSSTNKLNGLTMNFKPAVETVVVQENFEDNVNQPSVLLSDNSDSTTFTTDETGIFSLRLTPGVYRFENLLASTQEVWAELRIVITTTYNSQTYYWGPQRHMSGSSHFGQPLQYMNSWSTSERWITVSQTNYFNTLKTGSSIYPHHGTARGVLGASELNVIQSFPKNSYYGRNRYVMDWLNPSYPDPTVIGQHPSGGQGSITVKVEHLALNKSDNTENTDVDTETALTAAELTAAGISTAEQGTRVEIMSTVGVNNLLHSLSTGQDKSTISVLDLGDIFLTDQRGNVPSNTSFQCWDGTDWNNPSLDWAEGGTTPDGPLVRFMLRNFATIYQKPVKQPDMSYIGELNYQGLVVPSSAPFPIGATGTTYYFPTRSKFIGRDDVWEQTWIELDANENTDDITTIGQLRGPDLMADNTNAEGGLIGDLPAIDSTDEGLFPQTGQPG